MKRQSAGYAGLTGHEPDAPCARAMPPRGSANQRADRGSEFAGSLFMRPTAQVIHLDRTALAGRQVGSSDDWATSGTHTRCRSTNWRTQLGLNLRVVDFVVADKHIRNHLRQRR
jgi:hypothetical protein